MKIKNDLTIIFLTANLVPKTWAKFQKKVLLKASKGLPIITISREPLDWGQNILDTEPKTVSNIYFQLLRGAKAATTPYIGVAEDDTLYPTRHFHSFRPPLDTFAYNHNRLGIFTWGKPTFFWKHNPSNSTLIAPRQLLIDALEERFTKWPNGTPHELTGEVGRPTIEKRLGVSHHKMISFETMVSVLRFDHDFGIDTLVKTHNKRMGAMRSYHVPTWGKAKDIVKKFR
ncbi:MAG: hypothetical protein Q7R49_06095 [Candidatus Daviesbacteria bacterium]|nr:hypothetical protein [Candidatus Daviesbacteria bacterium]